MDRKTVIGHLLGLLVVFQSWHTLQKFFEVSTFRSLVGICIDNGGIAFLLHLFHGGGHHHLTKKEGLEDGILLKGTTSPYRIT